MLLHRQRHIQEFSDAKPTDTGLQWHSHMTHPSRPLFLTNVQVNVWRTSQLPHRPECWMQWWNCHGISRFNVMRKHFYPDGSDLFQEASALHKGLAEWLEYVNDESWPSVKWENIFWKRAGNAHNTSPQPENLTIGLLSSSWRLCSLPPPPCPRHRLSKGPRRPARRPSRARQRRRRAPTASPWATRFGSSPRSRVLRWKSWGARWGSCCCLWSCSRPSRCKETLIYMTTQFEYTGRKRRWGRGRNGKSKCVTWSLVERHYSFIFHRIHTWHLVWQESEQLKWQCEVWHELLVGYEHKMFSSYTSIIFQSL